MSIVTSLIDARIDLRVGQNVGQSRQYLKIHNKINCLETSSESTLSAIFLFSICFQYYRIKRFLVFVFWLK